MATYLFSAAAGLKTYICEGRVPNLLYLNFVHMQLCEFFMWSDQACEGMNQAASRAGMTLIVLQPLCALLSPTPYLELPRGDRSTRGLRPWRSYLYTPPVLAAYTAFSLGMFCRYVAVPWTRDSWCSVPPRCGDNPHLEWPWLLDYDKPGDYVGLVAYMLMCFVPLFGSSSSWWTGGAFSASLAYSLYHNWSSGTWGSHWCHMVNGRALGYFLGY